MDRETLISQLILFTEKTLQISNLTRDSRLGATRGWDSLRHMKLVLALEKEFKIKIPINKVREVGSIEGIATYISNWKLQ